MNKADYIHLFKEACGDKCNAQYNPCIFRQAADSLAALKPVATRNHNGMIEVEWGESVPLGTKLYTLDEVRNDRKPSL
jgi:hypothetical protein